MGRKGKGDESVAEVDDLDLPPSPKPSKPRQVLTFLGETALAIVVTLVITALLRVFVFQVFQVPSGSMEETLELKDRIVATRISDFDRGDIVVFEDPDAMWMGEQPEATNPVRRVLEELYLLPNSSQGYLVKRVVGMPGDNVVCCNQQGQITVNGTALDETGYLYTDASGLPVAPSDTPFDVTVPAGHIFVLGDHRDRSGDSRLHMCETTPADVPAGSYGFIPIDSVVGPVKAIVAPLGRITTFSTPDTFASVPDASIDAPAEPIVAEGSCGGS